MAKETAEQKLLKLIEATQAKDGTPTPPPAARPAASAPAPEVARVLASVQGVGVGQVAMPPFMKALSDSFRAFVFYAQQPKAIGLNEANKVLLGLIILMAVYLTIDFVRGIHNSQQAVLGFSLSAEAKEKMNKWAGALSATYKDMTEYASIVSRRNIFQPAEKKVEPAPVTSTGEVQKPPEEQIGAKLANYRLVGVSWLGSQDSITVMIEDKQTQVTHFLKQGEEIGGVKVETIYADGVVFSCAGEKMTMRL